MRLIVERDTKIATVVEIDVIFLFGTPLTVVKHDRGDRNVLANTGLHFVEANTPSAITHVSNRWTIRRGKFGSDDGGERVAAVAKTHRSKH